MIVAIPYENGEVFQHFGHTECFKLFEIEDGGIAGESMLDTNGTGHEALAKMLLDEGVSVLLCGGMGQGAKDALDAAGIEVISGITGDVNQAVAAYIRGELVSAGVNCDHHSHEEEAEEACGCGCSGNCGGCGGGCGGMPQIIWEGPNAGKICSVHYTGTFDDGTQFDSSYDRNQPLQFLCGVGMMIPGFDKAVVEMDAGQVIDIHLEPAEAYGEYNPNNVFTANVADMPGAEELQVGDRVYLQDPYGNPIPAFVSTLEDGSITFDCNSEMAGKALNFRIELLSVDEPA